LDILGYLRGAAGIPHMGRRGHGPGRALENTAPGEEICRVLRKFAKMPRNLAELCAAARNERDGAGISPALPLPPKPAACYRLGASEIIHRAFAMSWIARILLALLLGTLWACAYGPPPQLMTPKTEDQEYGFTEKQVSDRVFEVGYYGPEIYTQLTVRAWLDEIARTAQTTSHDLALWHAAQIAAAKGSKGFNVTNVKEAVRHYIVGRDYENVPVAVLQNVTIRGYEFYSGTYFRGETTLTIELTDETGAYDAAQTAAAMESRYAKAVSEAVMADSYYYFGPSSWLYGYDENYIEAPVFTSSTGAPKPPERKPLGQPYYAP
jgi:hypothetical protein